MNWVIHFNGKNAVHGAKVKRLKAVDTECRSNPSHLNERLNKIFVFAQWAHYISFEESNMPVFQ